MSSQRKIIEKPKGQGLIQFLDGKMISVRYALVMVRVPDDDAKTDGLTGQIEVWGTIETSRDEGTINLSGKTFVVKTDDGRCMQAQAKQRRPLSREWEIVSSGPNGLEPCLRALAMHTLSIPNQYERTSDQKARYNKKVNGLTTIKLGSAYETIQKQLICVTAINGDFVKLEYLGSDISFVVGTREIQRWIDDGFMFERPDPRDGKPPAE